MNSTSLYSCGMLSLLPILQILTWAPLFYHVIVSTSVSTLMVELCDSEYSCQHLMCSDGLVVINGCGLSCWRQMAPVSDKVECKGCGKALWSRTPSSNWKIESGEATLVWGAVRWLSGQVASTVLGDLNSVSVPTWWKARANSCQFVQCMCVCT